jgi:hypothetical protein
MSASPVDCESPPEKSNPAVAWENGEDCGPTSQALPPPDKPSAEGCAEENRRGV